MSEVKRFDNTSILTELYNLGVSVKNHECFEKYNAFSNTKAEYTAASFILDRNKVILCELHRLLDDEVFSAHAKIDNIFRYTVMGLLVYCSSPIWQLRHVSDYAPYGDPFYTTRIVVSEYQDVIKAYGEFLQTQNSSAEEQETDSEVRTTTFSGDINIGSEVSSFYSERCHSAVFDLLVTTQPNDTPYEQVIEGLAQFGTGRTSDKYVEAYDAIETYGNPYDVKVKINKYLDNKKYITDEDREKEIERIVSMAPKHFVCKHEIIRRYLVAYVLGIMERD